MLLAPEEKIVLITHRHWFDFAKDLTPLAALFILPFVLYIGWQGLLAAHPEILPTNVATPEPVIAFVLAAWILCVWMRFFVIWSEHFLDMWIVTDQRIIDIEQVGFFQHRNISCDLLNIQNISVEVKGVYETFLDFGNIDVETAGESSNLAIHGVPHPERIKEVMLRQIKEYREHGIPPGTEASAERSGFRNA
jgi:hypothetical protein